MNTVLDRTQIVASVVGSLRLEWLEASPQMLDLLYLWSRGEASDEDLHEAERRILAGEPLDGLLALAAPVGAPRAE